MQVHLVQLVEMGVNLLTEPGGEDYNPPNNSGGAGEIAPVPLPLTKPNEKREYDGG